MSNFEITAFAFILVLLILLAAFFACAETALMAVNRYRLRHKAELKRKYAVRLLRLLKRPDRLLGAILIGSTFANVLASSLATMIAVHYWGDRAALMVAIVLTFIILIFAEIAPKTLAAIYPDMVARWVAFPIQLILKFFYPIVWVANTITNGLLRLLHVRVSTQSVETLSREELRSVVHDTAGKVSRQYQSMLLGILDLNHLTVDDVMMPRNDIAGIDIEQPFEIIALQIRQLKMVAIPVYRETVNQLVGVLPKNDALLTLLSKKILTKDNLQQYLHEPFFVPEGTSLHVQLTNFQRSGEHIAFVVDEYGEIQGCLTLADILEEFIEDVAARANDAKQLQLQKDGSYLVDGAVNVREFNRLSGWHLPQEGPRTVNGLIVEYLEAMPRTGIAILIGGHPVEIVQVKDKRVKSAKISPAITHVTL